MRFTLFLKKQCLICSYAIADSQMLCKACQHKMDEIKLKATCSVCGIEVSTQDSDKAFVCGVCMTEPPYFNETHALWRYNDLSGHLIQRLKFYEDFSTLPFLVDSLAGHLEQAYHNRDWPQVILPTPLHFWRLFKRGFNQTGELGKQLGERLGLPFNDRILRKVKRTAPQVSLHHDERIQNLKSAFQLRLRGKMPYQSVALLDDVMTTGATVNEIAHLLNHAGVEEVHVWTLARALIE